MSFHPIINSIALGRISRDFVEQGTELQEHVDEANGSPDTEKLRGFLRALKWATTDLQDVIESLEEADGLPQ